MRPSYISGTSCSNRRARNSGAVRDRRMRGLLLRMSTSATTARTASPFRKKSPGICWSRGMISSLSSSSTSRISRFQIWYTSAEMISPTRSLYLRYRASFSSSMILPARFWRMDSTLRRPKSASLISSETSSPTSKSSSMRRASLRAISATGSSTSPSSTISRLCQISRSPFSGLMMMSKLSSAPYFLMIMLRNTSSRMPIIVSRSMLFNSLNSRKESIRFTVSIIA